VPHTLKYFVDKDYKNHGNLEINYDETVILLMCKLKQVNKRLSVIAPTCSLKDR